MINKRIKQLKEAFGINYLLTVLFKCEIVNWTSLSTESKKSLKEFHGDIFHKINFFYGFLITALGNTDHMKLKPGNYVKVDCYEIKDLLKSYDSLLDIAKSIDNLLYLLILKVV